LIMLLTIPALVGILDMTRIINERGCSYMEFVRPQTTIGA